MVVVIIALAATLAATVVYLARGTPAVASLVNGVPAQTTVIYDSAGKPIAELHGSVNRVIVSGSRLPLSLKQATVAVEDKRFYSTSRFADSSRGPPMPTFCRRNARATRDHGQLQTTTKRC